MESHSKIWILCKITPVSITGDSFLFTHFQLELNNTSSISCATVSEKGNKSIHINCVVFLCSFMLTFIPTLLLVLPTSDFDLINPFCSQNYLLPWTVRYFPWWRERLTSSGDASSVGRPPPASRTWLGTSRRSTCKVVYIAIWLHSYSYRTM